MDKIAVKGVKTVATAIKKSGTPAQKNVLAKRLKNASKRSFDNYKRKQKLVDDLSKKGLYPTSHAANARSAYDRSFSRDMNANDLFNN